MRSTDWRTTALAGPKPLGSASRPSWSRASSVASRPDDAFTGRRSVARLPSVMDGNRTALPDDSFVTSSNPIGVALTADLTPEQSNAVQHVLDDIGIGAVPPHHP